MADFETVETFARRIQLSPQAVYRAIRENQFPFPYVRIGRQYRIDVREFNEQVESRVSPEPHTDQAECTSQIQVIPIETRVRIGADFSIHGYITGITLRKGSVQYEVTWWDGATHCAQWLDDFEFRCEKAQTLVTIGFAVT